jgi:hypothetical protein
MCNRRGGIGIVFTARDLSFGLLDWQSVRRVDESIAGNRGPAARAAGLYEPNKPPVRR